VNHISVAMSSGLDNMFFSFLETLAAANNLLSCDGPVSIGEGIRIEDYLRNRQMQHRHELLIGYRYPPIHGRPLVELFDSTIIMADLDGICMQIASIQREHGDIELASAYQFIRQALESYLDVLAEPETIEHKLCFMMIPGRSFRIDPSQAFKRIETFYLQLGLPIVNSVADLFAPSALELLDKIPKASNMLIDEVLQIITANTSSKSQLRVINELAQLID